jgi:hypothetical protein
MPRLAKGAIGAPDAKNDRAAGWYESYGALRLEDAHLSLILPLAVAAAALSEL